MVSANQFSRCHHCGPGGNLSLTLNRFCGSPMPDLSPGDGITTPETCGIALEKRQPILVTRGMCVHVSSFPDTQMKGYS